MTILNVKTSSWRGDKQNLVLNYTIQFLSSQGAEIYYWLSQRSPQITGTFFGILQNLVFNIWMGIF